MKKHRKGKHKLKSQAFARPLIVTVKEFIAMMKYDFERHNPDGSWEEWTNDDY